VGPGVNICLSKLKGTEDVKVIVSWREEGKNDTKGFLAGKDLGDELKELLLKAFGD
jgi:hypothetical protein